MNTSHLYPKAGGSRLTVVLLAVLLAGCATSSVVRREPAMSDWLKPSERVVERPATPAASLPPALVGKEALGGPPVEAAPVLMARNTLPTNMISDLELTDEADVATILRTLGKAANLNVLISPQVSGQMRFAFKEVPWDEAFRSVVNSAGLTYDWEGGVLRVMTLNDMQRHLEMEKLLRDREDVRAEKRRIEPLTIQVIPIKYAKAGTLGATVRMLLAAEAGAGKDGAAGGVARTTVSVDEDNNTLIVHAIPDEVAKVVALVAQLDKAKPQVHIEARIVEANRDTARQLGVQWGGAMAQLNNGRLVSTAGKSDFKALFDQAGSAPVGFTMGMISERVGGAELLSMQLTALQRQGRIQILSSPSITTLDNEPALIESGEERAYREDTGETLGDYSVEWKKAVLRLEVIPHVVDGEYMRVRIVANKDSFDETKPESNGEFPVNTKRAETSVLLRDGDTVVIGGLTVDTKSDNQIGIPWLMNIPGLGYLFKNMIQNREFDETLIFITPKILAMQQQR